MESRHQAIAAGLALSLAFGAAVVPTTVFANTGAGEAVQDVAAASGEGTGEGAPSGDAGTDLGSGELPAPSGWDRADNYEGSPADTGSIMMLSLNSLLSSRSSTRISPTALSSEMKYFAQNESGSNYRLGFSYGDGYNAMGFYQFDRRYSLVDFMQACYDYDSAKYAMFAPVIARADELRNGTIYDKSAKRLTEIGQLAQDAWYAAYDQDPAEFSALQDDYGYRAYYLPVERILRNSFGIDISGRADCVKGLAWGMCNLFGSGGCQKYFRLAGLSEGMTDREVVNALCDAVVNNVGGTYAQSYRNRYERERATCLAYLDRHDAEAEQDGGAATDPETKPEDEGQGGAGGGDAPADTPSGDAADPDGSVSGGTGAGDEGPGADGGTGSPDEGGAGGDATVAPDDEGSSGEGPGGSDTTPGTGSGQDSDGGQSEPEPPSNGGSSNGSASDGSAPGDSSGSGSQDADDKVNTGNGTTDEGVTLPPADSSTDGSPSGSDSQDGGSQGGSTSGDAGNSGEGSKTESGDGSGKTPDGNASGDGASDGKAGTESEKLPGSTDEPERLPATADAASIAMVVSAGLSAVGTAVAVAGKRLGGKKIPFEDGFRE